LAHATPLVRFSNPIRTANLRRSILDLNKISNKPTVAFRTPDGAKKVTDHPREQTFATYQINYLMMVFRVASVLLDG
jgi:hypothetical protein